MFSRSVRPPAWSLLAALVAVLTVLQLAAPSVALVAPTTTRSLATKTRVLLFSRADLGVDLFDPNTSPLFDWNPRWPTSEFAFWLESVKYTNRESLGDPSLNANLIRAINGFCSQRGKCTSKQKARFLRDLHTAPAFNPVRNKDPPKPTGSIIQPIVSPTQLPAPPPPPSPTSSAGPTSTFQSEIMPAPSSSPSPLPTGTSGGSDPLSRNSSGGRGSGGVGGGASGAASAGAGDSGMADPDIGPGSPIPPSNSAPPPAIPGTIPGSNVGNVTTATSDGATAIPALSAALGGASLVALAGVALLLTHRRHLGHALPDVSPLPTKASPPPPPPPPPLSPLASPSTTKLRWFRSTVPSLLSEKSMPALRSLSVTAAAPSPPPPAAVRPRKPRGLSLPRAFPHRNSSPAAAASQGVSGVPAITRRPHSDSHIDLVGIGSISRLGAHDAHRSLALESSRSIRALPEEPPLVPMSPSAGYFPEGNGLAAWANGSASPVVPRPVALRSSQIQPAHGGGGGGAVAESTDLGFRVW